MTTPKVIIHIGKHKTGTTSFQAYMSDQREKLEEHGVLFVPMDISNFISASIIRDQLPIPTVKLLLKAGIVPSVEDAEIMLESFLRGKTFRKLVLSCEHFSYFRQQAEIDSLKSLLLNSAQIKPADVSVCLVLRRPAEFLKSYTDQIIKRGHGVSTDKASPYYCKPDSWLLDDNAIQMLWRSNFDRLDILQYENGNAVLNLCSTMDLPIDDDATKYYHNKTPTGVTVWIKRNLPDPVLKILQSAKKQITYRG